MYRIWYVHWDEEEAGPRAADLASAGHDVVIHATPGTTPRLPDPPPDVIVISLDRLPSHGASIARWLRMSHEGREIPVILEGGDADKAAAIDAVLTRVVRCETGEVLSVLESAVDAV